VRGVVVLVATALAGLVSLAPFAVLVGLGAHRHAVPWVVSASAVALVYGPAAIAAVVGHRHRGAGLAGTLLAWSLVLVLVLPVWFPGERNAALRTGLGLLGVDTSGWVLPAEPELSRPEIAAADPEVAPAVSAPAAELRADQIALPYEGEGRRMSVPAVFEAGEHTLELEMMFDTGATYTTLGTRDLARLGRTPVDSDPTIELHTANGVRTAQLVLLDRIWLGDLALDSVAIAVCDDCGGGDTAGLLGLNVSGGFNVSIDADRREVVFTERLRFDRKLDIKPFVDLDARFTRFPGGRVEVVVTLDNQAGRPLSEAIASVRCASGAWTVRLRDVADGAVSEQRRKLPDHEACEQYEIGLASAWW
jgi:hypothetical protein